VADLLDGGGQFASRPHAGEARRFMGESVQRAGIFICLPMPESDSEAVANASPLPPKGRRTGSSASLLGWPFSGFALHSACRVENSGNSSIQYAGKCMAKTQKKAAVKKVAPKVAAKPAAPKPIKEVLSKSGLVAHLAETSGVVAKDVRAVMAALEGAVVASVHKKGAGSFMLPGLLKISAISVPAKPKRKGINPFTKLEQVFAAKPASVKVKVRPLKKLKDAAA
jgi:nucleoid DNA-binding protein